MPKGPPTIRRAVSEADWVVEKNREGEGKRSDHPDKIVPISPPLLNEGGALGAPKNVGANSVRPHFSEITSNQNHALNAWFVRLFKGLVLATSQDALNDSSFAYYAPLPVNR